MNVSKSLRFWFKIHFLVDLLVAVFLIFFTAWTLQLFGFVNENLVFVRVVGAALLGIGGASLFTKTKDQFEVMLNLKIIWSVSAIAVILYGIIVTKNYWLWLFVVIFAIFSAAWIYYKIKK